MNQRISYTFLFVSILILFEPPAFANLSEAERLNGWTQVAIEGTDLAGATIQVGGHTGMYARCHPQGIDATPDFSSRRTSHICPMGENTGSLHYAGTYGEIVQVRTKTDSRGRPVYAVQVRVTDEGRSGARDQTEVGQLSWIYYNPRRPYAQLYNDGLATTHPMTNYLNAAAEGTSFELPWVTEDETVPIPTPRPPELDNHQILPEHLVQTDADIDRIEPGEGPQLQPALPGTTPEPSGEIPEEADQGIVLPPNSDMCSYEPQPETTDDGACMNRPPQRINGRWRECPARNLKDINRHASGALAPWLVDLVNSASSEVAEHSTAEAGNTCASPAMMMTLMDQESTFHPMSFNRWGDHGIAQFQLGTAESTYRYIQNAASPDSPMRNAINRGLTWRPSACRQTTTPWSRNLSDACFRAIQNECEVDGRIVASLYCPQFAVRLQAFHIKQICAEPFYVDAETGDRARGGGAGTINLTEALLGEGDPATEARFIASRYNRGYRIFNSAVHYREQHGSWPTAREYGRLWDVRRPAAYQRGGGSADPAGGGNLFGHTINRCYNWRTVGLCGGLGGTVFNEYREMTCAASQAAQPETVLPGLEALEIQ